ncbi:hypothetical protein T01_6406 [Trichinella spiralis]|uniref:Uncharacterized protein n=1 Tax=Trichinella spiralis TaxID=6334 RepID=A0A0V1BT22_TRISP|nr:hypothetical protein T01_6406 [Trichinella spiralis]
MQVFNVEQPMKKGGQNQADTFRMTCSMFSDYKRSEEWQSVVHLGHDGISAFLLAYRLNYIKSIARLKLNF